MEIASELKIDVRYYETDKMGIVHHSNYVRYYETGRSQLLKDIGYPFHLLETNENVMMAVVSVESKYRMPAKYGDVLRVVSKINKVPQAKMVVESEIYNEDNVLINFGKVVLGFIDATTRRPIRCPESLSKLIESLMK